MTNRVDIQREPDVVLARQAARRAAIEMGYSLVDQTRITTAVSELARNIFLYAGRGWMEYRHVARSDRKGLEFLFQDEGPGIADIDLAMTVGYTSGGGLGMGLSGSQRLMNEFEIQSRLGEGTTIRIVKWLG
ncbi:anti-sigma regulatory factor [Heliobacillus mobilis]|uniref:Anti-sigma regulatory factor n=1 Tax=Heliobacterium mobile TaxID=28064 RepID=A0A6I3SKG4_HELMO|nr:ATP-binding protein [Heliobacterium mobile]MTV49438.1 anti-sigma regulatory factor [Heliobacterium mobile]